MSAEPAAAGPAPAHPPAGHPSGDERFALLDKALTRARYAPDHLIEVLHVAQDVFGFLAPDVLHYLARELRLPPSTVYGVATFYHLFSFDPPGDHVCTVCLGTACFVRGADAIIAALEAETGVTAGQTAADRSFTLATARCLGSCGMAPVVVVDGAVAGHQTADVSVAAVRASLHEAHEAATAEEVR